MGKPLLFEIFEKPATSFVIGICSAIWFYIQKKSIGYSHVGLSYETVVDGHYWRIITSAFSHISILHLVFNMSALWSLGAVEQLAHIGLGMKYYMHYTLIMVVLSGLLVVGMYHLLIQKLKIEYFRRVTAVGYSCVVFGWMTILSVKQPSSKLQLFGLLSLPISFAPFESLIFTSIIVPQASFLGHLSGIIVGYAIGWGLINGMNDYWAISMLVWIFLIFVFSLKKSGALDIRFLEIESVTDPLLPSVRFLGSGNGRTLQMNTLPVAGAELVTQKLCVRGKDSTTYKQWKVEPRCGRPLGLRFDRKTGNLYIADAYYGLLVVGPQGGIATSLSTHAGETPILFANDLDIHENGSIFFTDTSKKYNRVNHFFILLEGESTGRLLRYDHPTGTTHVVLEGLAFPNGVQLSPDQSFLLYTETTNCRVMKYWLKGPKSGSVELVRNLPGFPDNVRVNARGQFWIAIDCCRTRAQEILIRYPWLRNIYFRLPIPMRFLARMMGMKMYTVITLMNENGEIEDVLEDREGKVMKLVSEVKETNGKLWIGTVAHNHIATVSYP